MILAYELLFNFCCVTLLYALLNIQLFMKFSFSNNSFPYSMFHREYRSMN